MRIFERDGQADNSAHDTVAPRLLPGSDSRIDPRPENQATGAFLRIAGFYAATFAVLGVYMQFFPVWLHDVGGLTHRQVTQAQTGQIVARTVMGPLWAQRVDRDGHPARALLWLAIGSTVAFAAFGLAHEVAAGLWPLLLCCVLFGCVYPPMHPILDNLALDQAHRHSFRYPRVRLWGSVSFLVVIVLAGAGLEVVTSAWIYWLVLGLLAVTVLAALLLPAPHRPRNTDLRAPLAQLLRQRRFVLFLLAAGLLQGSHGGYYALSTLYWRTHGIGEGTAGLLWAEGVVAEIALFFLIRDAAERLRPTTLLLLGAAGAVVRWSALALTVDPLAIAAVNWLHAASFGCTYLGSLRFLRLRVGAELQTSAQGLLGAATSGVGMAVGMLLAGEVYERSAPAAFWAMALLAGVGGALALVLRRPRRELARAENHRRSVAHSAHSTANSSPPEAN